MCMHMCVGIQMPQSEFGGHKDNFRELILSYHVVPGNKLSLSALATSTFTSRAISPAMALSHIFYSYIHLFQNIFSNFSCDLC